MVAERSTSECPAKGSCSYGLDWGERLLLSFDNVSAMTCIIIHEYNRMSSGSPASIGMLLNPAIVIRDLFKCSYCNLLQTRHGNVFCEISMTPSRDLDEVRVGFCGNEAVSNEKVNDDQATVGLEGGWVFVEDRNHLLDRHELYCNGHVSGFREARRGADLEGLDFIVQGSEFGVVCGIRSGKLKVVDVSRVEAIRGGYAMSIRRILTRSLQISATATISLSYQKMNRAYQVAAILFP